MAALEPITRAPRVLLVDDETVILNCLRQFLEFDGYEVRCASSGEAALALVGEGFDLLVTDLALGGVNGYEVAQRFREANPGGKVALLTGWSRNDTHGEAVDLVLTKPLRSADLLAALRELRGGGE